jgi:magnesium-transporting ATPase (P-type)
MYKKFTSQGLRVLAFAFKDIPFEDFERLKYQYNHFQNENDREALETNLTFIGLFALQDEIRDKVARSV